MTNPERREKMREILKKMYYGSIACAEEASYAEIRMECKKDVSKVLSALEALMPGTDYIQALKDALEQASIEISHYKDEIEKQAVEIESLEFKLLDKPAMSIEEVEKVCEREIEKVNANEYSKKCGFPARGKHYARAIASKLIGRG